MRRVLVPLALVMSLTAGVAVVTLRGSANVPNRVRHYYVQAENVDWVLAPTGYYDDKLGRGVAAEDTRFPAIVLRGYEDPGFTRPLPRPAWMGILGPPLPRPSSSSRTRPASGCSTAMSSITRRAA